MVCKICRRPLQFNDLIESKPSKYKKRKFYHAECYDGSHILTREDKKNSAGGDKA